LDILADILARGCRWSNILAQVRLTSILFRLMIIVAFARRNWVWFWWTDWIFWCRRFELRSLWCLIILPFPYSKVCRFLFLWLLI